MEKLKASKIAHWSDKLAVESEPGLTTAQLMLQSVHGHQIYLFFSNEQTFLTVGEVTMT